MKNSSAKLPQQDDDGVSLSKHHPQTERLPGATGVKVVGRSAMSGTQKAIYVPRQVIASIQSMGSCPFSSLPEQKKGG